MCWLLACLTSQQHASLSQGRICSDNFTCCHTETEAADQTFHLTQSQYTDTVPTSPSADPITPGAWQGVHWSANFQVTGMTRPQKNLGARGIRTPGSSALEADALTTRPISRGGEGEFPSQNAFSIFFFSSSINRCYFHVTPVPWLRSVTKQCAARIAPLSV